MEAWLANFFTIEGSASGTTGDKKLETQSFATWNCVIADWLRTLYPGLDDLVSADDLNSAAMIEKRSKLSRTELAAVASMQLVDQFRRLNTHLDFVIDSPTAFELLGTRLGDVRFNETPPSSAVKLLGWLDVMLDDSPGLVLIGLNHPFVPENVSIDPYLPQGVRTKLRLALNDRRFARDVYAMDHMISTRRDARFIVGRTASDGTPTPPSRLIVAAEPEKPPSVSFVCSAKIEQRASPSIVGTLGRTRRTFRFRPFRLLSRPR